MRRRLSWLNWPNSLTLLRVALVPVIAVLLIADTDGDRWWAFAVFVFAAFTDTIDGWLARRYQGITRWGQLADPIADKILIIGSLGILAWLGELPWWAVVIIVVREIAVTLQRVLLVRRDVVMPASGLGKLKTLSQVAAVTLYLSPSAPRGLAEVVLWIAVAITVLSGARYALGRSSAQARGPESDRP